MVVAAHPSVLPAVLHRSVNPRVADLGRYRCSYVRRHSTRGIDRFRIVQGPMGRGVLPPTKALNTDEQRSLPNALADGSFVLTPLPQCTAPASTATLLIVLPGALMQPSDYNELAVALQTAAVDRVRLWVGVQHIAVDAMFAGKFPDLQHLLDAALEQGFAAQTLPSGETWCE